MGKQHDPCAIPVDPRLIVNISGLIGEDPGVLMGIPFQYPQNKRIPAAGHRQRNQIYKMLHWYYIQLVYKLTDIISAFRKAVKIKKPGLSTPANTIKKTPV
jgi:hypothetical protein